MNKIKFYLKKITGNNEYGSTVYEMEIGYTANPTTTDWGNPVIKKEDTTLGTNLITLFNSTDFPSKCQLQAFTDSACTQACFQVLLSDMRGDSAFRSIYFYSPLNGGYVGFGRGNGMNTNNGCYPIFSDQMLTQGLNNTIEDICNTLVNSWRSSVSVVRTNGLEKFDVCPLKAVGDSDPNSLNYSQYASSYGWREYVDGLSTGYNWYTLFTGKFKIPTFYLETTDNKRIYLGKMYDNNSWNVNNYWATKVGTEAATSAYLLKQASAIWDYQSGTPLWEIFDNITDVITLKNGSTLSLRRVSDTVVFLKYRNDANSITREWFIGRWWGGSAIEWSASQDIPNPIKKQSATGMNDVSTGGNISAPSFMLSPMYNSSINDVLDSEPEGNYDKFDKLFGTAPISLASSYDGESWGQTNVEEWGFNYSAFSSPRIMWVEVCTRDYEGSQQWMGRENFNNTMSQMNWPNQSNCDNAEKWKILLGIDEGEDPHDPDHGGGSIGGGGGQSGGGGSFDDSGDNITDSTAASYGSSDLITNWYLGDLGSTALTTNLDLIGNWLKTTGDPDASHPFEGLGYKYSDKLANICSLKVIYSPILPELSGPLVPHIHGQVLHGSGDATPTAKKVTTQLKEATLQLNFKLEEYFGSFLDYAPYTSVQIYLPFAGVRELDPSDVIGKELTLKCTVDYMSGNIVYNIMVNTGTVQSIIYTFSGNSSYELPLTAVDYSQVISGVSQILMGAASVAVGVATYNPTMMIGGQFAAIKGAVETASNTTGKSTTKGSIGGSIGAMSPMKPYLIVTRPKMVMADDYGEIYGYPCMMSYKLGNIKEFVKVSECNWSIPGATQDEIEEIDRLAKSEGMIL